MPVGSKRGRTMDGFRDLFDGKTISERAATIRALKGVVA
jgi:hypothetical protein